MKKLREFGAPTILVFLVVVAAIRREGSGPKGENPSVPRSPSPRQEVARRTTLPEGRVELQTPGTHRFRTGPEAKWKLSLERPGESILAQHTRAGYRRALLLWRNGKRTREEDITLGNLISKVRRSELARVAGDLIQNEIHLLTSGQIEGFCGLLAGQADPMSIWVLCARAARDPRARRAALYHLASIGRKEAVEELEEYLIEVQDPDIKRALQRALRNCR